MTSESSINYPALYKAAGTLSANSQKTYLRLLRSEYTLLVVVATLSLNPSGGRLYYSTYAFLLIVLTVLLLYRAKSKPEQDWYKGRALAESIKTSTWRYCMRSAPFEDVPDARIRRAEFRNHLTEILAANRHIGERMPPDSAAEDQITESMETTRALSLGERKEFYLKNRIKEQRTWYSVKAGENKSAIRNWISACTGVYGLAIALVILRIVYPKWKFWPIDPLMVVASSMIGWMQIKKFNELSSAYTLTAHEIGILQSRIDEVDSEKEFSDFVNEAELAFSREHTQWVARQQS